jgi:transposase InsO family protein
MTALRQAIVMRQPPLGTIHHSDRGSQGGFMWSSQHRGGGWLRWLVGGVRIGLCGRSLLRLAARE